MMNRHSSFYPSTTVSIVTYNSGEYIDTCIRSLLEQSLPAKEIVITDNASSDHTLSILKRNFGSQVHLICNSRNFGFSATHNRIMRGAHTPYILVLNPDTKLPPDFLERLTSVMDAYPGLGSVTGKLLRMNQKAQPLCQDGFPIIDSTGMYFLPNQRHADRGGGEPDHGQYATRQLVFGTTAAAGLYRREMLEDVALEGEYFDEGFFIYREDVDLAWRSVLYGWACAYEPEAIGYHVRFGIPERRHLLSAEINYHSVKNRFLLRIKNMPIGCLLRHFPAIAARDLLVIGYTLLQEKKSIPAFLYLANHWTNYYRRRRLIARKSRIPPQDIEKWIGWRPRAFPFLPPPSPLGRQVKI